MIDIFEALEWLNALDDRSHLTKEAKRLIRAAVENHHSKVKVRRILAALQDVGQVSADPLEKTEIQLNMATIECSWALYPRAARHAKEAMLAYKEDTHRRAVALWILGTAQWGMLKNHSAYTSCSKARNIFRDQQLFFQHLAEQRDWYKNMMRQMEIDLAAKPEEIRTWLHHFGCPSLTPPSQRIVQSVQEKICQGVDTNIYELMQDLEDAKKCCKEIYERAEIYLEFGLAVYQLGNIPCAIELLRKAVGYFYPGTGIYHKQVVARCMLGAMEWMDKSSHRQAVADWARCIDEFGKLSVQADIDENQAKKKWYADHRDILQAALSERMSGPIPFREKPQRPTDSSAKSDPSERYKYLVLLVQGDEATAERLIDYERSKAPKADRDEWVERAIERILRQRQ